MITLKEAKNYLRVDYEEDDKLIQKSSFYGKESGYGRWQNGRIGTC